MARCDGTIEQGVTELEPTPPDENGDRWRTFEANGQITFTCSHGLNITGPRDQVAPLVRIHAGIPTQGQHQLVLGRH